MTTREDGTPSQSTGVEKPPSPRHCKGYKCGYHISPGLGICTDNKCSMCGVCHHPCAAESFQEISDIVADANKGIALCSVSFFRFSKMKAVTSEIVKMQQAELLKKNKEQLKKEAQELNIKVNCCISGASLDASKEVIVACVLEKKSYSCTLPWLLKFLLLIVALQTKFH